jgi:hypothetical protein
VSSIHLIGGGPGAILMTRRHLKRALHGLKKPLVAYVGAASNDNLGFQKMLAGMFIGTGARVEGVKLARKNASAATARRLLDDCDVVFMSGGDVEHGMNIVRERGVDEDLRRLARGGKRFLCISAGSIMTCRRWVRFPGDDDARAEPFDCLGIAPLDMDAHSEDDGWSELRVLVRLVGKREPKTIGYGVPSKGCLEVQLDGDGEAELRAHGAPVARFGVAKGEVVERAPLAPAG